MTDARRRLGLAALLALAALATWLVLRPAAVAVETASVVRGPLRVTVDEEGETRVRARFTVAAATTGRLLRVVLEEGDAVEAGAVLAHIEPAPLDPRDLAAARARLEAAEATERAADARVRRGEAALEKARRDAVRAAQLHRAGTLSTEAHERARLEETSAVEELAAARFAADAARHDVEAARAVLLASGAPAADVPDAATEPCAGERPCIALRAPRGGRVLRVFEESERIVAAGTPILEIGDPDSIEIVVDVLSADAVRIAPGARFLVEDWGGPGALEARVRRVEPSAFTKLSALGVEEQRVNVVADLVTPEPRLGDRFRVEARIVVWEADDVAMIPASALFRRGDAWSVFTLERRTARQRDVEIGHLAAFEAEVLGGVEPGETVILHPSDRVRDGVRVEPR
jgi:HlyD family secretion protein